VRNSSKLPDGIAIKGDLMACQLGAIHFTRVRVRSESDCASIKGNPVRKFVAAAESRPYR
jgi:hypothetical protein